jgi:3-carboxy-cis,cis-muconate cycloisomerase
MTSRLIDGLVTTDDLAGIFSDASVLAAMLRFEVALARVEADAGVVPRKAADSIAAAADANLFDAAALATSARASATPSVPFVKALTERVGSIDAESSAFVHWGATSQDVADTALVLVLVRARAVLADDHRRLLAALRRLSDDHARTVMLGRTLLQPATPITFGLKAAGWHAAVDSAWAHLNQAFDGAKTLQFGGASGTLAALGSKGPEIGSALARALDLASSVPWHTDRTRLAAVVTGCGVYTGAVAKIGRDVVMMMQAEVGEAAEQGGGSSTMPQKRNPAHSVVALAAGVRLPGIVSTFLTAMIQEHERAAGGWQAEWATVADAVQATGAAVHAMADAMETLQVFPQRMRANIDATGGTIYAEAVGLRLRAALGREAASRIIERALERTKGGVTFFDALAAMPEATHVIPREELRQMMQPDACLGAAEEFRRELLSAHGGRAAG